MADARLRVVIEAVDRASAEFKGLMGTLQQHSRQLRLAGVAMTGMGFGIAAALGMAAQAAAKEESSLKSMASALAKVGINYGTVKKELDPLIKEHERFTKFTDTEIRKAFEMLLDLTGDYDTSLRLLPLAMDLAEARQIPLKTAIEAVGEAAAGNPAKLGRYIAAIDDTKEPSENLALLMEEVGGRARAALGDAEKAAKNLSIAMNDFKVAVGEELLPILTPFVAKLTEMARMLTESEEPIAKIAARIGLIISTVGIVGGAILLALSFIGRFAAGWKVLLVIIGLVLSPIGLMILAILALIAGVAVFIIYWEDFKRMLREEIWGPIVSAWQTAFETIRTVFWTAWDFIVSTAHSGINGMIAGFEDLANRAIDAANFIMAAFNRIQVSIPDWIPGIGGKSFGINLTPFPNIALPRFGEGGIVTQPTLAIIGERPEAVIPLDRVGVTIIFNAPVYGMDDFRRKVSQAIKDTWNSGGFTEMNLGRT